MSEPQRGGVGRASMRIDGRHDVAVDVATGSDAVEQGVVHGL